MQLPEEEGGCLYLCYLLSLPGGVEPGRDGDAVTVMEMPGVQAGTVQGGGPVWWRKEAGTCGQEA